MDKDFVFDKEEIVSEETQYKIFLLIGSWKSGNFYSTLYADDKDVQEFIAKVMPTYRRLYDDMQLLIDLSRTLHDYDRAYAIDDGHRYYRNKINSLTKHLIRQLNCAVVSYGRVHFRSTNYDTIIYLY